MSDTSSSTTLGLCLDSLQREARFYALERTLESAAQLTVAALQVSIATLLTAAEDLPEADRPILTPGVAQLYAEMNHVLAQLTKKAVTSEAS